MDYVGITYSLHTHYVRLAQKLRNIYVKKQIFLGLFLGCIDYVQKSSGLINVFSKIHMSQQILYLDWGVAPAFCGI